MEAIRLLTTNSNIEWGMPDNMLIQFSAEFNCSIPFEMYGEKVICRYEAQFKGIPLYVTPVFDKNALVCLKAFFEHGEMAQQYKSFLDGVLRECGQPVYKLPEEWQDDRLTAYPCNIWVLEDGILEVGIHEERFVPVGYVMATGKNNYRSIYTDHYISEIGWDPKKYIK
jgi:hypothetical protein